MKKHLGLAPFSRCNSLFSTTACEARGLDLISCRAMSGHVGPCLAARHAVRCFISACKVVALRPGEKLFTETLHLILKVDKVDTFFTQVFHPINAHSVQGVYSNVAELFSHSVRKLNGALQHAFARMEHEICLTVLAPL